MKAYVRSIAAGVVFLALLAYIFIAKDYGRVPAKEELFGLNVTEATRLSVETTDFSMSMVRRGEDWYIEKPFEGLASTEEAEARLRAVTELKAVSTYTDQDTQDEKFGLQKPRLTAVLEYSGGKQIKLMLGSEIPSGASEIYALVDGRKPLYTVASSVLTALNKNAETLREKKLVRVKEDDVKLVSLTQGDQRIVVENRPENNQDRWFLTSPLQARADEFQTEQLRAKIIGLQAERFVSSGGAGEVADAAPEAEVAEGEQPGDAAAQADAEAAKPPAQPGGTDADYGFDKPALIAELTTKDGKTLTLTIGKQASADDAPTADDGTGSGYLYAKVSGRDEVAVIKGEDLESLKKQPIDLRDKSIVDLKKDNISYVKVQSKERLSFAIKRLPDGWHLDAPVKAVANAMKVDDLLWDLAQLEARDYVEENPQDLKQYGLAIPDIVIDIQQLGADKPIKIKIGYAHGDDAHYAQTSEGNQVYAISDTLINDLPEKLADIQSVD